MGISILQPTNLKEERFVSQLRALNADLFVVVAFRMLPEQVWMLPRLGTFNLHGSLLPKYRGAAPLHWAVINGERQTGLTTFLLDKMIDTGGILLQQTIDIVENMTTGELHDGSALIVINIIELKLSFVIDTTFEYAHKIDKAEAKIDWQDDAQLINQKIRALNPNPGAWFEMDGKRIKVMSSKVIEMSGNAGEILNDEFIIACGENALQPTTLKKEGKGLVTLAEFLKGNKVTTGTKL